MELYNYQNNIIDKLRNSLSINKRVLISAPTGAGKTIISKYIIKKLLANNKSVLFTTPRIKLAIQTQKSFGFGNLLLGNKTKNNNSLCTIASVQSLYSRKIKQKFDFIFIDECHYGHGSEYLNYIFETYHKSKIIGLSATPIDENGYLLDGYDDIIDEINVSELIKLKFLTNIELYTSPNTPNFEKVEIINGDYNQKQASEIVKETKVLSNTISEWQRLASQLKTIVFGTDISHAKSLTDEFTKIGIKAGCVHSKLNDKTIEQTYSEFNKNIIQVLINVDMATFGFDEPSIECILFARPIKSLRLYKQMVGRGIRAYKGKSKCLMLDCANVVVDNGMPLDSIKFVNKPVISPRIDKLVSIERNIDGSINYDKIDKKRIDYLQKIGSLIDLYANKVYVKEQDLLEDCKMILKRAGFYFWRQNSGKAFMDGRWVTFTDKNGLPDITLIYHSVYIGLELKLPKGKFTKNQKETLPEFIKNKTCFFIVESVLDLFDCLEILQKNIIKKDGNILIKESLFNNISEKNMKKLI